ncbi:WD repeat domain 74 lethal (2) k09848 [Arctopsyche grandis]|uniref:WD repeat domain 74 lethal (2) k09848 n=1 Tax=Arctopsyche grandis TaxID=121162 RepID=UPI00406D967A
MALNFYGLDLIVASNIGTIKHVKYNSNPNKKPDIKQLQRIKELEKGQGITCMTWADAEQTKFIVGRKDRTVQTFNLITDEFSDTKSVDFGEGKLQSVSVFGESIFGAVESGVIKIWKSNTSDEHLLNTGGPIEKMKHCSYNSSIIATGGKENDLKLWDLEKRTTTFHAKNVPHDWLQLRVPIWVSDICFLPENNGNVVAVCSRYGAVRLYDARAQRRPVCNVDFKDQAGSCISLGHYDKHVIVGTGRGLLNLVDLRKKGKLSKSYKGAVGAITDVMSQKDANVVVSTSLDRHLRIHNAESKEIILKQYLTSKLTCFLLRTVDSFIKQEDGEITIKQEIDDSEIKDEDEPDQEYDEMFDNMEIIREGISSKIEKNIFLEDKTKDVTVSKKKMKSEAKKRKGNDTINDASISEDLIDSPKKAKLDKEEEKVNDEDIDQSIIKLLRSTEKLKRKLLSKNKKKKAKSLFYK